MPRLPLDHRLPAPVSIPAPTAPRLRVTAGWVRTAGGPLEMRWAVREASGGCSPIGLAAAILFLTAAAVGAGHLLAGGLDDLCCSSAWCLPRSGCFLRVRQRDQQPDHESHDNATHHTGDGGYAEAPDARKPAAPQIPVVSRPPLRLLEHLVGGDDLPELLFRARIASIEVRVTRLGGVAERHLDRLIAGARTHAENIIRRLHGGSLECARPATQPD